MKERTGERERERERELLCMNLNERVSIWMGMIIVSVAVIESGGRVIIIRRWRGRVIGVGVEGIRRRETEEGPEAESKATQLLQREAAD